MALPDLPAGMVLRKLAVRLRDNAATDRAAQLSYYFVFALFPFLFTLVTLAAYLPVKGAIGQLMARLDPLMPDEAMQLIRSQLHALATEQRPRLLTLGLLLALWSASRGVDALRTSLNLSYDVKESRPWWKVQAIALIVTVATSALMLLAISGLALGSSLGVWLADKLHVDQSWAVLWGWLRWPITALGVMLVLALLYYFLPDVKQEWRFITPGSLVGTLLWLLLTWGFSLYAENFGSYDKTYGAIGGVIVLMTWFFITGLVFILGGELNAVVEHASAEGKAPGARAPGEAPAPPLERPSIAAPAAAKSAKAAERARRPLWSRWRKSPA
ncbi:MAG TPA: YihY/virulence factor BrkB family protein [Myxococcales bacterium]|nr:YihY/virulence factor BrkB family protein [Myxococcales bacterium]